MTVDRASGILLHPTSLPGDFPIGDLGPEAHFFVDWLSEAGCGLWQVLPLGPTGFGNSPYQCHSSFAGNAYLISPDLLVRDGWLPRELLPPLRKAPSTGPQAVEFGAAIEWKQAVLRGAYDAFDLHGTPAQKRAFEAFCEANRTWLDEFALYMAMKESHAGASWLTWPPPLRRLEPDALGTARLSLNASFRRWQFSQMLFFSQWNELRHHANRKGVQIIGDIPIFAAEDSADVWGHQELFRLGPDGRPLCVAGVPPDYFAATGQLWGNPHYDWRHHAQSGFHWWINRVNAALELFDLVRIDHFRGLAASWEVPGDAETAANGQWMPGPSRAILDALVAGGSLPRRNPLRALIAEDLGVMTPDVVDLLEAYALPGMRVLQFGFAGLEEAFLPHNYVQNCVAYTGTHDNDTARGWFDTAPLRQRKFALKYLRSSTAAVVRDMVEAVWASRARLAVVPFQDLLELGSEGRMNYPGKASGNWSWRMPKTALQPALATRLRELNRQHNRLLGVG